MAIARSTREVIRYVLVEERSLSPDQQTTFLLAALPTHLMLVLLEMAARGKSADWMYSALKAGLRGWERFPDATGRETPFDFDKQPHQVAGVDVDKPISDATLDWLPTAIAAELAKAVLEVNQITAADAKN